MTERRRTERRHQDRRRADPIAAEESLFGALGADTQWRDGADGADHSRFGAGWQTPANGADSEFVSRRARRLASEAGTGAFQRIYRAFVGARAGLGVALLAAEVLGAVMATSPPLILILISLVYAAQALSWWLLPRFRKLPADATRLPRGAWLATIGTDLLAFSALHLLDPVASYNYVALLVLPVLMAGVLTPRLHALATASAATLMLLAATWRGALGGTDVATPLTQAGLAGTGFFIITLLAGELAGRLAREESMARGSLELARQQAQLNRLVIEEMADGVLVVDRRSRVRAANPAARRLLAYDGIGRPAPFQLQDDPAWTPLRELIEQAFEYGSWPEGVRDATLRFGAEMQRSLRLRARFTRRRAVDPGAGESAEQEVFCVLFLEDLRSVEARTRQEKLAAMGRVSAGIAHEIRNPLAAISQANALLREDALTPEQQRLALMVSDNAERLKRIVDDVLEVAPGIAPTPRTIDAGAEVAQATAEWARAIGAGLGPTSRLRVLLPNQPLGIVFDPEHLRRVLVNLLDNAWRHAGPAPGAVWLELAREGASRVRLTVASDGPPIAPDVERHLFEPFFSTRSRGTGLGLYICRELCERYGASIDYRPGPPEQSHRNRFQITMRAAAITSAEARLQL